MAAPESADAAAVLGGRKSKKPVQMHIRPAEHGAYIVRHSGNDMEPSTGKEKEYALTNKAALMAHIDQQTPDDAADEPAAGAE